MSDPGPPADTESAAGGGPGALTSAATPPTTDGEATVTTTQAVRVEALRAAQAQAEAAQALAPRAGEAASGPEAPPASPESAPKPTELAPPAQAQTPRPPATPRRMVGLDVARGLMLVVSVAVNAWITAPAWFEHAPWEGVHPVDLVFPTFVTLSGCGLAFAYGRRVPWRPTIRRVCVLLAAGFANNAHTQYMATGEVSWGSFHVLGVLQFYAALVLLVAVLHLLLRRWWLWPLWTLALAGGYTWALAAFATGCPDDALTRACNPSGLLDPALFGAGHVYHQGRFGHDPEGVVALVGALVAISGGASMGHLLKGSHLRGARLAAAGAGLVAAFAAAAWACSAYVPTMKRLWTPPFALGVASGCALVLLVLHLLLDEGDRPRWTGALSYPLVGLGRNSLLVYFGSHVLMTTLLFLPRDTDGVPGPASWAHRLAATAPGGLDPALWLVLAAVAAWTVLACLLHARRIYLRP